MSERLPRRLDVEQTRPVTVTVTLTDVDPAAILDVLLATEIYAERTYGARNADPAEMTRYNALAAIVLPLRDAMDKAVAR